MKLFREIFSHVDILFALMCWNISCSKKPTLANCAVKKWSARRIYISTLNKILNTKKQRLFLQAVNSTIECTTRVALFSFAPDACFSTAKRTAGGAGQGGGFCGGLHTQHCAFVTPRWTRMSTSVEKWVTPTPSAVVGPCVMIVPATTGVAPASLARTTSRRSETPVVTVR